MTKEQSANTSRSGPWVITPDEPEIAPRKHKVVKGESLGTIARRYSTTETTLIWMNSLANAMAP